MTSLWKNTQLRNGLFFAFLGVLIFSFTMPFTKIAVGGFDPYFLNTARAVIAGVAGVIALVVARVPMIKVSEIRGFLWPIATNIFGWPIFITLALERTTSAHAAVIAAFMPLMTAFLAVISTKERVAPSFWLAAGTGTAILVAFSLSRGGAQGGDFLADLFVIAAVVSSSWGYVKGANLSRERPGWQVISWVVVLALPISAPLTAALWFVGPNPLDATAAQWFALLGLAFGSMFFGFFAWYQGLAMLGTAYGSQVQQLQSLMTLGWSALLLGETVTLWTIAAALGVIASVIWAQRSRARSG
jgi:drug/metabolite transporter (DMT)-like permease